jgi:hypothetical protein
MPRAFYLFFEEKHFISKEHSFNLLEKYNLQIKKLSKNKSNAENLLKISDIQIKISTQNIWINTYELKKLQERHEELNVILGLPIGATIKEQKEKKKLLDFKNKINHF